MNKLLALLQILIKQTDENHKLTTNQLIEKLAEQGVAISRYALRTQGSLRRNRKCLLEIPTSLRSSE